MAHEDLDERPPIGGGGRRGDIGVIGEEQLRRAAGKVLGHVAEFDERLNAALQQTVIDRVDILEVGVFAAQAAGPYTHVVIQDAVEADPFQARFLFEPVEVMTPGFPQCDRRPIRSGATRPDVIQRTRVFAEIDVDRFGSRLPPGQSAGSRSRRRRAGSDDLTTIPHNALS